MLSVKLQDNEHAIELNWVANSANNCPDEFLRFGLVSRGVLEATSIGFLKKVRTAHSWANSTDYNIRWTIHHEHLTCTMSFWLVSGLSALQVHVYETITRDHQESEIEDATKKCFHSMQPSCRRGRWWEHLQDPNELSGVWTSYNFFVSLALGS